MKLCILKSFHLKTFADDWTVVLQTGHTLSLGHLLHMTKCMQGTRMTVLMCSQQTTHKSIFLRSACTKFKVCIHFSSMSLSCSLVMFFSSILSHNDDMDKNYLFLRNSSLATNISALQSLVSFISVSCANSFSVAI